MKIEDSKNFLNTINIPVIKVSKKALIKLLDVYEVDSFGDDFIINKFLYETDEDWEEIRNLLSISKDIEKPNHKNLILTQK